MDNPADTYSFRGQEQDYTMYRPNWSPVFGFEALRIAGISQRVDGSWEGTANGNRPVIACIGAGTGADAAVFKMLGCNVFLVEPNKSFLDAARTNLNKISTGHAEFLNGNAMNSGLAVQSVDLIVIAQALHTLRQAYSNQYLTQEQASAGRGAEEISRAHWETLLRIKAAACISVWYYNPDPRQSLTHDLHNILLRHCPKYLHSGTQLLNAEFFKPNYFQPWISLERMFISDALDVQVVSLSRGEVGPWLGSYSFKPNEQEFNGVVRLLQETWFDKYQKNGKLDIAYVGFIAQGPLRADYFPIETLAIGAAHKSPLMSSSGNGIS